MKKSIIYTCDFCGKQSDNYQAILECECSHLGVSIDQLLDWKLLQRKVRNASYMNSVSHNEVTDINVESAIEELNNFEIAHNLVGKKVPKLC